MCTDDHTATDILYALNMVALEFLRDGSTAVRGLPPDWLGELCPEAMRDGCCRELRSRSAFLDHFLADAEGFWEGDAEGTIRSGVWSQAGPAGQECLLEAAALRSGGRRILLLQRVDGDERGALLQRGRENAIDYHRDITALRRVEAELMKARGEAEAADRAKSAFLANMSHEIRTPMNGIIGMADLLLETDLEGDQREYLDMLRGSAHGLLRLLNDILDFSKVEADKLDFEAIPLSLRDCLKATMGPFALQAHDKGLELVVQVEADVPDALVGDPGRLGQVISNLVGNAIKFTDHGEVVVHVSTSAASEESALLRFAVRDTGIGIAADKKQTIFDAFTQADGSTSRRYGGTGLGLAISNRLVQMMAGEIGLESEVGEGSTFHFTARFGLGETDAPPTGSPVGAELEGVRVLVVDDSPTAQELLVETLRGWRMEPVGVGGGDAARGELGRAISSSNPFGLYLIDCLMQEEAGYELAEEILKDTRCPDARIIMLTPATPCGETSRCRSLGLAGCVPKPVFADDLLSILLGALGRPDEVREAPGKHPCRQALRELKILLAEDNPVNQKVVSRMLEKRGHRVSVADTGARALEALSSDRFDLILMDVEMPEMGGLEATAEIRKREAASGRHIPIVAMTAHALVGDRERFLGAGMDGYVPKPIDARDLLDAIESLVSAGGGLGESPETVPGVAARDLDRDEILARVDGDRELLATMVQLFGDEWRRLVPEIRSAVSSGDAQALGASAHALKGAAWNFGEGPAFRAVRDLEEMARENALEGAEEACEVLEAQLELLQSALAGLVGDTSY